jgi:hypothetical protein
LSAALGIVSLNGATTVSLPTVKDPANPTVDEIEQWARTAGALYPMEDWDLMIAGDDDKGPLLVSLADDPTCVNRDAVLNFLYVYAGQVLREGKQPLRASVLREVVRLAASAAAAEVRLWADRAAIALDGGAAHDYSFWFEQGWKTRAL